MNVRQLEQLAEVRRLAASGEARRRRQEAGWSLSEMADPVHVDQSTIWRWELGKRRPRGPAALRYGRVLELIAPAERAS
jgi:transcriptional regulator with XRE-family HTH domain